MHGPDEVMVHVPSHHAGARASLRGRLQAVFLF